MDKNRIKNLEHMSRYTYSAFTFVEILIVVAILGILAAVIVPEYRNYTQKAKEAAAMESLQTLRTAIERYAVQHNGVPPGYPGDFPEGVPGSKAFINQLSYQKAYLSEIPENPFNGLSTVMMIPNDAEMPESAAGSYGWIYKAKIKQIRLDHSGTDSQGQEYYNY
jgi:prepilin-type N-terminal cleavage/methylation domain-containing protein